MRVTPSGANLLFLISTFYDHVSDKEGAVDKDLTRYLLNRYPQLHVEDVVRYNSYSHLA